MLLHARGVPRFLRRSVHSEVAWWVASYWAQRPQSRRKSVHLCQEMYILLCELQGSTARELAEFSLHSISIPNSSVAGQHSQHFEFVSTDYQNPMPFFRAIQVLGQ